jgi:hypothetical protein
VYGLVVAADARSRFAGQVNRELESLQAQAAGQGKGGPMSARDALHTEFIALQKVRKAWQKSQVAAQCETEASTLVKQAEQLERQAADVKQPSPAILRFLHHAGVLAVFKHLMAAGHRLAQQAAQQATKALEEATAELHAAQVASMSTMQPAPVASSVAAAPAPQLWQVPPKQGGPGDELVKAVEAMQKRTATVLAQIAAQPPYSTSALARPVGVQPFSVVPSPVWMPPHPQAAEPSVPSGWWLVLGLCALGSLQLLGFALVFVLYYRGLALAQLQSQSK